MPNTVESFAATYSSISKALALGTDPKKLLTEAYSLVGRAQTPEELFRAYYLKARLHERGGGLADAWDYSRKALPIREIDAQLRVEFLVFYARLSERKGKPVAACGSIREALELLVLLPNNHRLKEEAQQIYLRVEGACEQSPEKRQKRWSITRQ